MLSPLEKQLIQALDQRDIQKLTLGLQELRKAKKSSLLQDLLLALKYLQGDLKGFLAGLKKMDDRRILGSRLLSFFTTALLDTNQLAFLNKVRS